ADDALGDPLRQSRPPHGEGFLPTDALVPAAQEKTGIVGVVIEVVVREEEMVDLGGEQTALHELVCGGWTTVEHDEIVARVHHVGAPESLGSRCGGPGSQDVYFDHAFSLSFSLVEVRIRSSRAQSGISPAAEETQRSTRWRSMKASSSCRPRPGPVGI